MTFSSIHKQVFKVVNMLRSFQYQQKVVTFKANAIDVIGAHYQCTHFCASIFFGVIESVIGVAAIHLFLSMTK